VLRLADGQAHVPGADIAEGAAAAVEVAGVIITYPIGITGVTGGVGYFGGVGTGVGVGGDGAGPAGIAGAVDQESVVRVYYRNIYAIGGQSRDVEKSGKKDEKQDDFGPMHSDSPLLSISTKYYSRVRKYLLVKYIERLIILKKSFGRV